MIPENELEAAALDGEQDDRHMCPNCGKTTLDGQGGFSRRIQRIDSDGQHNLSQRWYQMWCGDCDQTFALLVEEDDMDE